METYQEEYNRILREIQKLEKSRDLSDGERKKMEEMQRRARALENYANDSGKLLARISELQEQITLDMTKLDQIQEIMDAHSVDNSSLTNEEIQKMRKYLFEITGSKDVKKAGESRLKEIFDYQSKRYDLSRSTANLFSSHSKIGELDQLCDKYRELEEIFLNEDRISAADQIPVTSKDVNGTVDTQAPKTEMQKEREEKEKKINEQTIKKEELKRLKKDVDMAKRKLKLVREPKDENGNTITADPEKVKEAEESFFKAINKFNEFKEFEIKDLLKELSKDADKELGIGNRDKEIERAKINLIIELLKIKMSVLNSELEELMSDPKGNADRIKEIQRELEGINGELNYWIGRNKETQILSEDQKEWKPLANSQSSVGNGQGVSQSYSKPVSQDKQLKKVNGIVDKIKVVVDKVKAFYDAKKKEKERNMELEAMVQGYAKKREERINALNSNNFIGEPVLKDRSDMQYLAFPPAKVVGADFYHTVQLGDKLQYVKEPLADMDFSYDAIKARICELQDKFGDTARERQGKKIGIVEKLKYEGQKQETSAKREYEMRRGYQKFLENPDKIIRDFIGNATGPNKKYKMINLMCSLEAANNVEEAGKACVHGMSQDLFGLGVDSKRNRIMFGQLSNGSLQRDIEKIEMSVTEKLRKNLRIIKQPVTINNAKTINYKIVPVPQQIRAAKAHPRKRAVQRAAKNIPQKDNNPSR